MRIYGEQSGSGNGILVFIDLRDKPVDRDSVEPYFPQCCSSIEGPMGYIITKGNDAVQQIGYAAIPRTMLI